MSTAFVFTIFGYGAPGAEDELRERWASFILEHHYETTNDFYASGWLGTRGDLARLCGRSSWRWSSSRPDPLPRNGSFLELCEWYDRYVPSEE